MLEMQGVTAGYDGVPVLRDVSINVGKGELVGLLGANNAGKSTLINVISGTVPIMSGRLIFDGEDITNVAAQRRVELGLVQVPEGRLVFPQMSVRENLLLGGYNRKARPERASNMDHVVSLFPRLGERCPELPPAAPDRLLIPPFHAREPLRPSPLREEGEGGLASRGLHRAPA